MAWADIASAATASRRPVSLCVVARLVPNDFFVGTPLGLGTPLNSCSGPKTHVLGSLSWDHFPQPISARKSRPENLNVEDVDCSTSGVYTQR